MKTNVGGFDRAVRIVLGLIMLAWLFVGDIELRWVGVIGIVPLATGLFGFCPLYRLLGLNTCPLSRDSA
ncbi:MAG: DUF2892 domain-containing protein [Betaproteobacteria bacterium]|nr:MAG: DUF2892 domain-containing protein [Betaproteobacteria bacterium]